MNNYANSGLILPASALVQYLPWDKRNEAAVMVTNPGVSPDEVWDFFSQVLGLDSPYVPAEFMKYDGEEPNDSLEVGVLYALWDENYNPFYTRTQTPLGRDMEASGALPQFAQWVVFC